MFLESFFAGFLGGATSLLLSFGLSKLRRRLAASKENKKRLAQIERKKKNLVLLD